MVEREGERESIELLRSWCGHLWFSRTPQYILCSIPLHEDWAKIYFLVSSRPWRWYNNGRKSGTKSLCDPAGAPELSKETSRAAEEAKDFHCAVLVVLMQADAGAKSRPGFASTGDTQDSRRHTDRQKRSCMHMHIHIHR